MIGWVGNIEAATRHTRTFRTAQLKLYSLYSPSEHPPDTVHRTKSDADADAAESAHRT